MSTAPPSAWPLPYEVIDFLTRLDILISDVIIHSIGKNKRRPLWAMACFLFWGIFLRDRSMAIKNRGSDFIA